jgi:hypothetical protein
VSPDPLPVPSPCRTAYDQYAADLAASALAATTRTHHARCVRRFLRWLPAHTADPAPCCPLRPPGMSKLSRIEVVYPTERPPRSSADTRPDSINALRVDVEGTPASRGLAGIWPHNGAQRRHLSRIAELSTISPGQRAYGLVAELPVDLYGTEGHACRVPGGQPMLMAAPNIQICASHVLTGVKAISAPPRRILAYRPPTVTERHRYQAQRAARSPIPGGSSIGGSSRLSDSYQPDMGGAVFSYAGAGGCTGSASGCDRLACG